MILDRATTVGRVIAYGYLNRNRVINCGTRATGNLVCSCPKLIVHAAMPLPDPTTRRRPSRERLSSNGEGLTGALGLGVGGLGRAGSPRLRQGSRRLQVVAPPPEPILRHAALPDPVILVRDDSSERGQVVLDGRGMGLFARRAGVVAAVTQVD